MSIRRPLAYLAGVVALATVGATAPAPAQAAPCPTPSGSEVTFTAVGTHSVRVPPGVQKVMVTARGGHGGEESATGQGGRGGIAEGTVVVSAGTCLTVHVGQFGGGHGGIGYGHGGDHGVQPLNAKDGAGGGGASAVVDGSTALVVAGGGGGGGGQGEFSHYPGGAGGDGAGGEGAGTPSGADGSNAPLVPAPYFLGGNGGGQDGHDGGDGETVPPFIPNAGAGGGGGAGASGGSEGANWGGDQSGQGLLRQYGGGGGGGGDSFVIAGAADVRFDVGPQDCSGADCDGEVTLSWVETPGQVRAYGGANQSAVVTERFSRPLQARVLSLSGLPVPGTIVTFAAPATPPSATFADPDGGTTATAVTDANGVATAPPMVAGAVAGPWTATATVSGVARPARYPLRTMPATTATALWSSANPSVSGQSVRFSAEVDGTPSSAPTPTGSIEFRLDGAPLGDPVALDVTGSAQSPTTVPDDGTHTVTAVYSGDDSHIASQGEVTQRVDQGQSLVRLTSSANPSVALAPVTFTAQVDPVPPAMGAVTGTVAFLVDGTALGAPVALDAGGQATSPAATGLGPGPHTVRAVYSGDAALSGAAATFEQEVGDSASAVAVTVAPDPTVFGQPATASATVRGSGGGIPTGELRFAVDGDTVCDGVALDAAGSADCPLPAGLQAGARVISAVYGGDADFDGSAGSVAHAVAISPTAVTVEATPAPSVAGVGFVLHADVDPVAPGSGTPTGGIRFSVDGIAFGGVVPLGADGADSVALRDLAAGPHVIEAVYNGDGDFAAGERRAVALVDRALTTTTVASSANPSLDGATVFFEVLVAPVAPGTGAPGGTVQLRIDGADHGGPVSVGDGPVRLSSVRPLAPGDHDVRVSYSGNRDRAPSEATLVQTVLTSAPSGGGGGGGSGGSADPAVPTGPVAAPIGLTPPTDAVADDCGRPVELTRVHRSGRRVALGGLAERRVAGRRVTLREVSRRGARARIVAHAWVRTDGTFSTRTQAHRPAPRSTARYTATVGGHRSSARRLGRRLVVADRATSEPSRVRVRGRLAGDGRRLLVLERVTGCDRSDVRQVRTIRTWRGGGFSLTVTRPPRHAPVAVYRLRAVHARTASLPIVVRAVTRSSGRGSPSRT
jgi:hypothetical protein